jgi:hypothetical protein
MKKWEAQQKHEEDFNNLTKELGFLNSKGQITRWRGAEFWPKFETLGHSSCDFDKCKCKQLITK